MSQQTFLDALLYSLVNYIAYIPLVFFPFRKKLRYPLWLSVISLALLSAFFYLIALFVITERINPILVPFLMVTVSTTLMLLGLREHFGKLLFTILIVYNIATFINVFAKYLEILIFPEQARLHFHWTMSLFILIGVSIFYAAYVYYMRFVFHPLPQTDGTERAWNVLWISPFSFYLMWILYCYTNDSYRFGTPEQPLVWALLLIMSVGSFITYYFTVQLLLTKNQNDQLKYQETINQSQFKNIERRIDEARRARHDLRHHIRLMETMVEKEDYDSLQSYLKQYQMTLPDDSVLTYCKHYATNSLLLYFAQMAAKHEIQFDAVCKLDESCPIPTADLTVIFSNLLENALNACLQSQAANPSISLNINYDGQYLLINVKNSAKHAPKQDPNGQYLSTSHSGYGVGIDSIRSIAEKYQGLLHMEYRNQFFTSSVSMRAR